MFALLHSMRILYFNQTLVNAMLEWYVLIADTKNRAKARVLYDDFDGIGPPSCISVCYISLYHEASLTSAHLLLISGNIILRKLQQKFIYTCLLVKGLNVQLTIIANLLLMVFQFIYNKMRIIIFVWKDELMPGFPEIGSEIGVDDEGAPACAWPRFSTI